MSRFTADGLHSATACTILRALCFLLLVPQSAYAYIDPMSGSFILQLLLAAIFGSLFAIKGFYAKLRALVLRMLGKAPLEKDEPEEDNTEDDD